MCGKHEMDCTYLYLVNVYAVQCRRQWSINLSICANLFLNQLDMANFDECNTIDYNK